MRRSLPWLLSGDLVLTGACPVCGTTVKRLIESEPDS